jgi:hypothetical protein
MSGGAVQLVATGIQDSHFTGNPEISFFRSNYKRHTHYAASQEYQLIQGTVSPGNVSSIRIEKKGDLLSYVYLTARDTFSSNPLVQSLDWAKVIQKVELVIGGQIIDTQDVFFSNTISPAYISSSFSQKFFNNTGTTAFYPLQFFFCKDYQSAIPLVALQYHDVEIRITWNQSTAPGTGVGTYFPPGGQTVTALKDLEYRCWANFIYLDQNEREWFSKNQHDMLIYQVQTTPAQPTSLQELAFSHPVKFLAFQASPYTRENQTLKLQVNGVDLGIEKSLPQYTTINPYYHTQFGYDPSIPFLSTLAVVPFCLDTTKLQPTGTLNFSRIDTFRLLTQSRCTLLASAPTSNIIPAVSTSGAASLIYGVNYNILRIRDGMAGLLYSS